MNALYNAWMVVWVSFRHPTKTTVMSKGPRGRYHVVEVR